MIRFVHPWFLLLLSVIPFVGMAWGWQAARAAQRLGRLVSPPLQPRLVPVRSRLLFNLQLAFTLAALALMTVAAARPQWGRRAERTVTRSRNVVIALDVSRSMLAADVHPNRLERAKVDIMDLVADLAGDRAALLAFRRRGVLLCPLTTDYTFLRQALDGVSPDSAPRGETDLADAIRKSLEAMEPAFDQHNAILLISDGEDLAGQALSAARDAAKRGVPIFTVGIGDPAGAKIPGEDGKGNVQYRGADVITRLTEETLSALARESGGQYIALATAGTAQTTLGAIYRRHVRQVAAREQQETVENLYVERYVWFLAPAVALLLAAALLSRGRLAGRRRVAAPPPPLSAPRQRGPPPLPAAVLLVLLAATVTLAQAPTPASRPDPASSALRETNTQAAAVSNTVAWPPGRSGARAAQSLFRRGRYNEAAQAFLSAARGVDIEEAQTYRYNAAVAKVKAGDPAGAAALLQSLVLAPGLGPRAADLLGAVAWEQARQAASTNDAIARLQHLEQAGGGVQQALRAAPDETRHQRNLGRVAPQLPSAREDAHIAAVMQQHGQTPPDALLERMFREQRALTSEAPAAFTNDAPTLIRLAETFADRQDASTDLWIPLKQKILESPQFTNAQQRAAFEQMVESTRDALRDAARRFRDLDATAVDLAARGEPVAYSLWRQLASPPALLSEDIDLQSNTLVRTQAPLFPARADQPEAQALTGLFRKGFPAWADQLAQQAQADTNAPTLTPEARAEIEKLAEEAEGLQAEAVKRPTEADRVSYQQQALADLLRIRDLLPKQKSPAQQPQPQPQPQRNPEQQPSQQPEQQPKESPNSPEPKDPEPPQDVQEMLRRALQREKEHEAEKRNQMRNIPLSPDERDQ